jgi:hypothetical protein
MFQKTKHLALSSRLNRIGAPFVLPDDRNRSEMLCLLEPDDGKGSET